MAGSNDPKERELVVKAIIMGQSCQGCCEWDAKSANRVRQNPPCQGLTPEGIRKELCDYVAEHHTAVKQVREKRKEYSDRRFYYKVILPVAGALRGLFVEVVLVDDDAEFPTVQIVNSHE